MDLKFTIRPAEPDDEGALGELDRRCWSPMHAVTPRPEPPYRAFFASGSAPADFLVAETPEHGPVGYAKVVPPTPLAANAHVRQIQGFLVDERARGRGLGRALLEAACALARKQGAHRITLRVLGHNVPARGLYTAGGFDTEGVLPGEFLIDGEYVDDVLMGRSLA